MYFKEITKTLSLKQTPIGVKHGFSSHTRAYSANCYVYMEMSIAKRAKIRFNQSTVKIKKDAVTWCYTETLAVAVYMSVLDNLFNSSIGSGQISFISPTQQKEHPLDQLSLVSHVSSLGFDQPDSTGQSTTPKSRLLSRCPFPKLESRPVLVVSSTQIG